MWLVQRCKPKGVYQEGQRFSEAFYNDYMGSAEFEFGALPKSLRRLAGKPDLKIVPVKFTNRTHHVMTYYILADNADIPTVMTNIEGYISRRHLKEYILFGDMLDESEHGFGKEWTLFWCVDEGYDFDGDEKSNNNYGKERVNFAFSFDPEQLRTFKLALPHSLKYMDAEAKKK